MDLIQCNNCHALNLPRQGSCEACGFKLGEIKGPAQSTSFFNDLNKLPTQIKEFNTLLERISGVFHPFRVLIYLVTLALGVAFILYPFCLESSSIFLFSLISLVFFLTAFSCSYQKISKLDSSAKLRSSFAFVYFSAFLLSSSIFVYGCAFSLKRIFSFEILAHPYLFSFGVASLVSVWLTLNCYARYEFSTRGLCFVRKKVLIPWSEIAFVYSVEYYKAHLPRRKSPRPRSELRLQIKPEFFQNYKNLKLANDTGVITISWLPYTFNLSDFLIFLSQFPVKVERRMLVINQMS